MPPPSPPESGFLKDLYGPLMENARLEVMKTLAVATLAGLEMPQAEIARRTELTPTEVRDHLRKLRDVAWVLEREERT